jgi:DNA-directed RNA polymerase subunit RPC12/RpoP
MSEFKFTCPVCGQHIAADSSASGLQIECPTCFQRIIIPQAPASGSKYLLSATQYIRPPRDIAPATPTPPIAPVRKSMLPSLAASLLVLLVAGLLVYIMMSRPGHSGTSQVDPKQNQGAGEAWSLDLGRLDFPDEPAKGLLHNRPFASSHAILRNGSLALRQEETNREDLVINVYLPQSEASSLQGRVIQIATNTQGAPRVVLRWDEKDLRLAQTFTNGYALKLRFGRIYNDRLPGSIYLCTPDVDSSYVAGAFNAEIRDLPWPPPR